MNYHTYFIFHFVALHLHIMNVLEEKSLFLYDSSCIQFFTLNEIIWFDIFINVWLSHLPVGWFFHCRWMYMSVRACMCYAAFVSLALWDRALCCQLSFSLFLRKQSMLRWNFLWTPEAIFYVTKGSSWLPNELFLLFALLKETSLSYDGPNRKRWHMCVFWFKGI